MCRVCAFRPRQMKLIPLSFLLFLPAAVLAKPGGPCAGSWGPSCICLDNTLCSTKWGGEPAEGRPGDYPCPHDPKNVMGCFISPCPGKDATSRCMWKSSCNGIVLRGKPLCLVLHSLDAADSYGQTQFALAATILSVATTERSLGHGSYSHGEKGNSFISGPSQGR